MATFYVHQCSKCGHSVSTSGPHEFYRDDAGEIQHYGHPTPASEEARQRGISGFFGKMYCVRCDETFDVVMGELKAPQLDAVSAWRSAALQTTDYESKEECRCPKCGDENLMLEPQEDRKITCPRCKKGKLEVQSEIQT